MRSISPHLKFALLPISIGITGHRDVSENDVERARRTVRALINQVASEHPHSPLRLISPLAEGADRLAAEEFLAAQARRVQEKDPIADCWELVVPLPLPKDLYTSDFPTTIDAFESLVAKAALVVELPLEEGCTPSNISTYGAPRDAQYAAVGRYVAHHSNVLIALWDGTYNGKTGGTAQIVEYKLRGIVPGHAGLAQHDYDRGEVFHIHVNRAGIPGAASGPIVSPTSNHYSHLKPDEVDGHYQTLSAGLRAIDVYNATLIESGLGAAELDRAGRELSPGAYAESPNPTLDALHEQIVGSLDASSRRTLALYQGLDQLAVLLQRRRERLLNVMYGLGALALAFQWTAHEGIYRYYFYGLYLVTMLAAIECYRRLRRPQLENDQHFYRVFAESLRVQFYWSIGALADAAGHVRIPIVSAGLLRQQLHEIGWVREGLRAIGLFEYGSTTLDNATRKNYALFWIELQLRYFKKTEVKHDRSARLITQACYILTALNFIFMLLKFLLEDRFPILRPWVPGLGVLEALVLAWALLLQTYAHLRALSEMAKNMGRMRAVFARARVSLQHEDPASFNRSLDEVGRESLTEAVNWLTLRKSRPAALPH